MVWYIGVGGEPYVVGEGDFLALGHHDCTFIDCNS